ncbi:DUF131 domain-containing protein [Methanolobus sp. WCC4]|uniref:TIGR00304 family membrane protein n=1 Tax=Methanolobus sp. WCC4 TaxID=3125784 RepID=UPI0030F80832
MVGIFLVTVGILMIFTGILLIFASGFFGTGGSEDRDGRGYRSSSEGSGVSSQAAGPGAEPNQMNNRTDVRGGGIIMLGPIPIIIGSDNKSAQTLIILAIILMLLYFLLF